MTDPPSRSTFFARRLPWIVAAAILLVVIVITLGRLDSKGNRSGNVDVPSGATAPADKAPMASAAGSVPSQRRRVPFDDPNLVSKRRNEQRRNVQKTVDSAQTGLAAQFLSEKTDAAWAPSKERALAALSTSDQIRSLNADISNMSVDCKSTVCRVTGDFPTMVAGDDWFTLYMNNVAPEIPYASYKYVPNKDGTVRIEVYGIGRK